VKEISLIQPVFRQQNVETQYTVLNVSILAQGQGCCGVRGCLGAVEGTCRFGEDVWATWSVGQCGAVWGQFWGRGGLLGYWVSGGGCLGVILFRMLDWDVGMSKSDDIQNRHPCDINCEEPFSGGLRVPRSQPKACLTLGVWGKLVKGKDE
jgi:hypothetical protein